MDTTSETQVFLSQEFFQKGVDLQQRGLIDNAIEEYERALRLEPSSINIMLNLGAACLQKGLSDRAKKLLLQVVQSDPENSMALFNLGKTYLYREEYEDALEIFEDTAILLPEDIDVKKSIAFCQHNLGNKEKSTNIILALIDSIKDDFETMLQLGDDLRSLDRYDEALEIFKKASVVNCSSIAPLLGIYYSQLALNAPEKALTALKRAIMIEPVNQELLVKLTDLHMSEGRLHDAIEVINKGLESIANPELLREKYSEIARRLPILRKKASAQFESTLSKYETEVYNILDNLYDGKFPLETALKELDSLYKQAPTDMLIADELANLLFQSRQFSRASEIYSEILLAQPSECRHQVNLAKSLAMNGDAEIAKGILEDSIRDFGHHPELDLAITELDLFDKEFARAASRLEIILKEYPDEQHALFLYAYTSMRLDKLEVAEKTFKKLFEGGRADEELTVWYSRLTVLLGKPDEALKIWENFSDGMESLVEIITRVELTLASGDSKGIMKHLHKIGDYQPKFLEDHLLFGKAFFFAGDFASAQREFELVLRLEAKNAEAIAMAAMNSLIRNKTAKFWNYWQHAITCDSLYAVAAAMVLKDSLNFSQRERLKAETIKLTEMKNINPIEKSHLFRLLKSL